MAEVLEGKSAELEAIQKRQDELDRDAEALGQQIGGEIEPIAQETGRQLEELAVQRRAEAEVANAQALDYILNQVYIGGQPLG